MILKPVLTVPWDIHQQVHCLNHNFFQLLSSYLLAASPYLCACKSLKNWKAVPGPNEKGKPIDTAKDENSFFKPTANIAIESTILVFAIEQYSLGIDQKRLYPNQLI